MHQHKHPHYEEQGNSQTQHPCSHSEEYSVFPYQLDPYPSNTPPSIWYMGCPDPQSQDYESNKTVYQPNHLWFSNAKDHFPTWQDEGCQAKKFQPHGTQAYDYQNQDHPIPQENFEPSLDRGWPRDSTEERIEELIASQQDMERFLKSNDELTLEMQHSYDEQKSSMNEMIKQMTLLTDIMKGIQEDRAGSKGNERKSEEEGVNEPEEREPSDAMQESEVPLKKQEEEETVETEPTREESLDTPRMNEITQGVPEEVKDETRGKGEVNRQMGLSDTLFYLRAKTEHTSKNKAKKFVPGVEEKMHSQKDCPQ